MESEYIALSHSMRELIGIRQVLKEIYEHVLSDDISMPTYTTKHKYGSLPQSKVFEDNEACLKFASLPKMSSRTKHIKNLEIKVETVGTKEQLADQFTKGLSQEDFETARFNLMGW